jgi:hypothetical protein
VSFSRARNSISNPLVDRVVHPEIEAHRYPHHANYTSEAFLTLPTRRVASELATGFPGRHVVGNLVNRGNGAVGNFWDWNLHGEIGAHRYKVGWEIDWQKLLPRRGFEVLPRRWVVERTFSWLSQNRRMSKDYERLCATAEAFVYVAMTRLMVRRLARV